MSERERLKGHSTVHRRERAGWPGVGGEECAEDGLCDYPSALNAVKHVQLHKDRETNVSVSPSQYSPYQLVQRVAVWHPADESAVGAERDDGVTRDRQVALGSAALCGQHGVDQAEELHDALVLTQVLHEYRYTNCTRTLLTKRAAAHGRTSLEFRTTAKALYPHSALSKTAMCHSMRVKFCAKCVTDASSSHLVSLEQEHILRTVTTMDGQLARPLLAADDLRVHDTHKHTQRLRTCKAGPKLL